MMMACSACRVILVVSFMYFVCVMKSQTLYVTIVIPRDLILVCKLHW